MTDQTVPDVTDDDRKLAREWAEFIESDVTGLSSRRKRAAARVILDAVPALPTLADMTPEERDDCQWMQADTAGADDTCVLFVIGTRSAKGVAKGGRVTTGPHKCFTPRPDLPRLKWPDNDQ